MTLAAMIHQGLHLGWIGHIATKEFHVTLGRVGDSLTAVTGRHGNHACTFPGKAHGDRFLQAIACTGNDRDLALYASPGAGFATAHVLVAAVITYSSFYCPNWPTRHVIDGMTGSLAIRIR